MEDGHRSCDVKGIRNTFWAIQPGIAAQTRQILSATTARQALRFALERVLSLG